MALLGRDTQVTGPLPDGTLLLETFQGREVLGTPYRYDLTLLSTDPAIAVDSVLGQMLTVQLKLDTGTTRFFTGIVTYFAKAGLTMRHTRYVAVLQPMLKVFDYTRDCRIFFDMNAPDLATDVLAQRGFSDVQSGGLQGSYRTREYTVQYRESDCNFVQRLLEEDGIYYFFKHEKDKHTLLMADSAGAHAAVAGYEKVLYLPTGAQAGLGRGALLAAVGGRLALPGQVQRAAGLRPHQAACAQRPDRTGDLDLSATGG